jgi:hypothetical protein
MFISVISKKFCYGINVILMIMLCMGSASAGDNFAGAWHLAQNSTVNVSKMESPDLANTKVSPRLNFDGHAFFGVFKNSAFRAEPVGMNLAKFMAEIEVGLRINTKNFMFRPWANISTLMNDSVGEGAGMRFHPASVKYDLGLTVDIGKQGMYLEMSHMCWHPVDSGGLVEQYDRFTVGWKW